MSAVDHHPALGHSMWQAAGKPSETELLGTGSYYWGPPSATLDWCEENYATSPFLAEFFNSVSNAGMLLLGGYGVYRCVQLGLDARYIFGFLSIITIGVGSFLFHGTLLFSAQLMDELPMLWAGGVFSYICSPPSWRRDQASRIKLALGTTAVVAGVSALYIWNRNAVFFESCFAVVTFVVTIRCMILARALPNDPYNEVARTLIRVGTLCFGVGFTLWTIDNTFCDHLRSARLYVGPYLAPLLQFHAWWHAGSTAGAYALGVFVPAMTDDWNSLGGEKPVSYNTRSAKSKNSLSSHRIVVDWSSIVPTNARFVDLEKGSKR